MAKARKELKQAETGREAYTKWLEFLRERRRRTGVVVWRQVVAALEAAYSGEPGAPEARDPSATAS